MIRFISITKEFHMQGLFSKRYKKQIDNKTITYPSFNRPLRKRLSMICNQYNEWHDNAFDGPSDTQDETVIALRHAYGEDQLMIKEDDDSLKTEAKNLDQFIIWAYPHRVIDALEAFYRLLPSSSNNAFQQEVNAVLTEESSPWRIIDGHMYMVDSRFLDALKDQIENGLRLEGFSGAHEEFQDARSHLQAGEFDVAVLKANRAFESTMMSLLNQSSGTADDLLKRIKGNTDLLNDIPVDVQSVIVTKVLQGLPILRHKIAGHGQGSKPVKLKRAYGELAVNLSASYVKFLIDLKSEQKQPIIEPPIKEIVYDENDDCPF